MIMKNLINNKSVTKNPKPEEGKMKMDNEQGFKNTEFKGTVFGQDVEFNGSLKFKDSLRINGSFEGDIVSDGMLIVGQSGVVKANVKIGNIVVEGTIDGNITCRGKVELRETANITGDIKAAKLVVAEGVVIVGKCEISKDSSSIQSREASKSKDRKGKEEAGSVSQHLHV